MQELFHAVLRTQVYRNTITNLYFQNNVDWRRLGNVDLMTAEFDVLHVLVSEAGKIVNRDRLAKVLGRNLGVFDRAIDMHISNLRKKLEMLPNGVERIRPVRNAGYLRSPDANRQPCSRNENDAAPRRKDRDALLRHTEKPQPRQVIEYLASRRTRDLVAG